MLPSFFFLFFQGEYRSLGGVVVLIKFLMRPFIKFLMRPFIDFLMRNTTRPRDRYSPRKKRKKKEGSIG
jgi:hypothetical protein